MQILPSEVSLLTLSAALRSAIVLLPVVALLLICWWAIQV